MKIYSNKKTLCLPVLIGLLLAGCGSQAQDGLKAAADALAVGDYSRALQLYQHLYRQSSDPDTKARAQFWTANIYFLYLDNVQGAIEEFENFVHDHPRHPLAREAYWRIATTYQDIFRDRRRAILKYQELIDHFPGSEQAAKAQLAIAKCYAELGDQQQAVLEAQQVISGYPHSPELAATFFFLADTQFLIGDYPSAKANYRRLIERFPRSELVTEAWMGLAMTQEELKEYEAALESYRQIKNEYANQELIKRRIQRLRDAIKQEARKKRRMRW